MLIDITKIPVSYINLEKDYVKDIAMQDLLGQFENVKRINATYIKDNAVKALAISQKEAVKSISVPGLVLEDDCVRSNFRTTIEVPDDADIVFLGVWDVANPAIPSGKYLPAWVGYNDDLVKVNSMYGSHAILYTSELGKTIAERAYEVSSQTEVWNDSILNRVLPFINAYALRKPIFAQTSQLQHTNIELYGEFVIKDPNYLNTLISTPEDVAKL